jgi:hypothetical protein
MSTISASWPTATRSRCSSPVRQGVVAQAQGAARADSPSGGVESPLSKGEIYGMTQIPLSSDARERFLMEIAAVVPKHRISEVYFFPPLRQGPMETGIAVIAAMPVGATPQFALAEVVATESAASVEGEDAVVEPVMEEQYVEGAKISARHVVYSARYRWTRKGPDRGKWECEVVAEADAPLLTVETVVQGVRQRANEPLEPEKLDGETVRSLLAAAEKHWQTTA